MMLGGVIGNILDSDSSVSGSSPGRAALSVSPVLSGQNPVNRISVNSKFSADLPDRFSSLRQVSNHCNFLFIKLSAAVLRAPVVAPLFNHVTNIVGRGPKEQMVWSDANPVITTMAHNSTVWYRSVVNLPGDAVGVDDSPSPLHGSISFTSTAALPFPARAALRFNFRPESDFIHVGMVSIHPRILSPLARCGSARYAGGWS